MFGGHKIEQLRVYVHKGKPQSLRYNSGKNVPVNFWKILKFSVFFQASTQSIWKSLAGSPSKASQNTDSQI